ncbi:MAG: threonine/serine exporter family protein [Treponema sp.]|nr:threonine/serine exporter family protein [Treponema sp.]
MIISKMIVAAIWSGIASIFCSLYFNTRYLHAVISGILGVMSYFLYLIIRDFVGSEPLGYFIGTVAVAVASEILAVLMKNPATVFLLSGLLPLVPGGGLFYTMRAAVQKELDEMLRTGYQTIMACAAIVLGVAVVSSIFRIVQTFLRNRKTEK